MHMSIIYLKKKVQLTYVMFCKSAYMCQSG